MDVLRYDIGTFRKPKLSSQGFLKADALLSRSGIFTYKLADGSTHKELRPEKEVFDAASLQSLSEIPVTDDHPQSFVNSQNAKELSVGFTGHEAVRDNIFIKSGLTITDSSIIEKIMDQGKRELSCGYTCTVDEVPGEFNGEKYDAVQRDIRYNHVALVDSGRAGPEVSLRLDKGDAAMVTVTDFHFGNEEIDGLPDAAFAFIEPGGTKDEEGKTVPRFLRNFPHHTSAAKDPNDDSTIDLEAIQDALEMLDRMSPEFANKSRPHLEAHAKRLGLGKFREDSNHQGGKIMAKITIDKIDYEEVDPSLAKAVVEKIDNLEAQIEASGKDIEELKGKKDALEADVKKKGEELEAAKNDKLSREDIMKEAKTRIDLETFATKTLGDEDAEKAEFDKLDDKEIKKLVIEKLSESAKLDDASDDYINARYDHIVETQKERDDDAQNLNDNLGDNVGEGGGDWKKAQRNARKRDSQAWSKPIGSTLEAGSK